MNLRRILSYVIVLGALELMSLVGIAAEKEEWVKAGGAMVTKKQLDFNCLRGDVPDRNDCYRVQAGLLPALDMSRREEFGESYDPGKYLKCRLEKGVIGGDCDIYRLRRKPNPEYWPNPKLPRPVVADGDKKVYRSGMSSEEYFKALCEAEAGEFIYKTVENVDAVYQIRPRDEPTTNEGQDRYVLEAPYFYEGQSIDAQRTLHGFRSYQYSIFEQPNLSKTGELMSPAYRRYEGYTRERDHFGQERINRHTAEAVGELRSRYGFYWYGIKRQNDRKMAVAGGELVVVDLETNEVLGLKRGFALAVTDHWGKGYSPTGISWGVGGMCPSPGDLPYMPNTRFISKVLKPKNVSFRGGKK